MPELAPDDPMHALLASMTAIERLGLQLSPSRVLAYRESVPSGLLGAYLSAVGKSRRFQIGLLTDEGGSHQLVRLLARGPQILCRPNQNHREILGKLLLHAATSFVARLDPEGLQLGPVLFVDGTVHAARSLTVRAADVAFGCTRALLVLMTDDPAADEATARGSPALNLLGTSSRTF